jgi:PAS domain S-box-containing protein
VSYSAKTSGGKKGIMKTSKNLSLHAFIAGAVLLSAAPFAAVGIFRAQLYRVMDISPYLVFHNATEFLSVVVSLSIFGVGWFAFARSQDRHSLFLSAAFLGIGLLDFMHALGYPGMPPFVTPNSVNKASLFWLAARSFNALAFLSSAFVRPGARSRWLSKLPLAAFALAAAALGFLTITFFPGRLPAAFIDGVGQTALKRYAEYAIIAVLVLSALAYWRRHAMLGDLRIGFYLGALTLCVFGELSFTLYKSAYDSFNMLGHAYKALAFLLIYRGIFIAAIEKPYEELRRKRSMLEHIMDSIPQSIFWKDAESVYVGCNMAFARGIGREGPGDVIGKDDFDLYPGNAEYARKYRADDREVMDAGRAIYHIVENAVGPEGRRIWIDTTKIPLKAASGRVEGVLGIFDDITERRQVHEELNRAIDLNQQILAGMNEGLAVYDREGRVQVWNRFMENLSRLEFPELAGKKITEAFPLAGREEFEARLAAVLGGGEDLPREYRFGAKDGKTVRALDKFSPLRNGQGDIVGAIESVWDVTETRVAEEQLRQSQKMEALGQLAGGVAHDFNNMLQVIIGYGAMLAENAQEFQREKIAAILAAAERAAQLTGGLLSYSRKQVFKIEPSDLGAMLAGVERFLRRILGEDVALIMDRPPAALVAAIDRTHMQQVFLNLAANARDAMPSGGKLVIGLERIEMDSGFAAGHGLRESGPYAQISVSDTGTGIPKENIARIFEPFFTTKESGKGTGLGLSIVHGIVTQHNGAITCYSEPGFGTTFKIYIPLSGLSAAESREAAAPVRPGRPGASILVAEDDPNVRNMTVELLERDGFRVRTAADGKEAVELYGACAHDIDLVILDALMPEMDGARALALMRSHNPGVKALFMSGYAREIISGRMLLPDDVPFIGKPVMPAQLLDAIYRTLEDSEERPGPPA